jgi:hypothetical protein
MKGKDIVQPIAIKEEKNPRGGGFVLSLSEPWDKKNIGEGGCVVGCWRLECTLVLIKPL